MFLHNLFDAFKLVPPYPVDHSDSGLFFCRILAPHISRLPMPEDYALQELQLLTRAYMLEMSAQ